MSDLVALGAPSAASVDPASATPGPEAGLRWRAAWLVFGPSYLLAATVCAFVLPEGHSFSVTAPVAAVLFLVGDRINLGHGSSVSCAQGALVLLCFTVPLNLIPLALLALQTLGTPRYGRRPALQLLAGGFNSWMGFAAPVLLAVLAPEPASWHHWPAYLVAFSAQLALAELVYVSGCHICGASANPAEIVSALTADAGLTPIGLAAATDLHASPGGALAIMVGATALMALAGHEHEQRRVQTGRALRDPMTGLANRALFEETMAACESRCRRKQEHAAVLLVDLDDFKPINDTLGHHAGDEVLCAFADGLRDVVRAIDVPARLGGDEFALILAEPMELDGAEHVVEKLRQHFASPISLTAGQRIKVGFSIGVALFGGEISAQEATVEADAKLYANKRSRKTAPADRHPTVPVL
jgi:diguanylate cyclase (GGDEF)-like protein